MIVAWAVHIADEVASDALTFYNPLIRDISGRELTLSVWITVLAVISVVLCAITPLLFRGALGAKLPVYLAATLMLLNSLQHLVLLVFLQRLTPGTRSAPVLLAASLWVLRETRRMQS